MTSNHRFEVIRNKTSKSYQTNKTKWSCSWQSSESENIVSKK